MSSRLAVRASRALRGTAIYDIVQTGGSNTMINGQQPLARVAAMGRIKTGANWFYWIAGLSAFKAMMNHSSGNTGFSFYSLGLTNLTSVGSIGFVASLIICGLWVFFGLQAGKGQKWAFMTGLVLYGLDALLLLLFAAFGSTFAYIAVAFHGYVIYRLILGLRACNELGVLDNQVPVYAGQAAPGQQGPWY